LKKSQITVYVIIGLVLILGLVLVYFLAVREHAPQVDEVPDDIKAVQEFMLQCVRNTAEDSLVKLGEHAGYIDPENAQLSGRSFDLSPVPTQSDVLFIGEDHPVPYWWYMKTPLECTECIASDAQMPSLEEIQDQINMYIEDNLDSCTEDFESLEQYTINAKGGIDADTTINLDDVSVYVKYPLAVSTGTATATIENFPVTIDLDFRDIYMLAASLATAERNSQYLETILMHLVSAYSDLDPAKLPPLAAFDEGYQTVMWSKTATQTNLANLLKSYIPFIQLQNSLGYEEIQTTDSFQHAMYELFTLKTDEEHPRISVNYLYLDWPIDFDITPRSGELLKPSSSKREFPFNVLPPVQTNHYEFFYDVAYPVAVELRDADSFEGKGYSFLFALEGNVIDNKNLAMWHAGEGTFGPLDLSKVTYEFSEQVQPVQAYVPETQTYINMSLEKDVKKLFCNENQRISGEAVIEVLDSETLEPIKGADIIFGCGKYTSCNVGTTDNDGIFAGSLPVCVGEGYILVERDGYATLARSGLTTKPRLGLRLRLKPNQLHELDISVRTIGTRELDGYAGLGGDLKTSADVLQDDEQAYITVTRIKKDPFEPISSQVLIVEPDVEQSVMLSEATYYVEASLVDNDGIFIAEHNESVARSTLLIPEIKIKPAPVGGAIIPQDKPWAVNRRHLDYEVVEFYLLKAPKPHTMIELDALDIYRQLSIMYPQVIEPEFH